jgi:dienelactone hydrolase
MNGLADSLSLASLACFLLAAGMARAATPVGGGLPDSLRLLYEYDRDAPVDAALVARVEHAPPGVLVEDITYGSPLAGRVTATVVAPERPSDTAGSPPYAGIVFLHWGQGDRSEFVWEAALYARVGAVCITVDAPWARPGEWKQPGESFAEPRLTRGMYIQNIVDLRRAVDVLAARGDVDPARIAYVGHSFGATQGGVLAGVEKRIRAFVLMGGLPSVTDLSLGGARQFDEYAALVEERVPPELREKHRELIAPLAPEAFIGFAAPSAVLMQFGRYDSWISKRAADAYFAAASEPKDVRWYPTSHEFTDIDALADRALWLRNQIGIGSVTPILERTIEERAREWEGTAPR